MKRIYSPDEATGFDWDDNNIFKNWEKHLISYWECEEVFFNTPLLIKRDDQHSDKEQRYFALGATDTGRMLFIAFTMRETLLRPISFREMTKKETSFYERHKKNT